MQQEGSRADLYRQITDKIIAQIEAGAGTYRMPWHHDGSPLHRPMNVLSRNYYRGINVFVLWGAAQAGGYPTGIWGTYWQWQEMGYQVRKGEKGTQGIFWNVLEQVEDTYPEEGEEKHSPRFVARGFSVFNAAQVDGYVPVEMPTRPEGERIARAEQFYAHLGIDTRFGGDSAYYVPSRDYVQMPPFEQFRDGIAYYAVLLHEGGHATGAPHRLDRNLTGRFGSEAYAAEELIADWASCMACMTLELSSEPRPDHAQYIASWTKVMRDDKRAVFTAASKAQEIVDWMWRQQPLTVHPG